MDDNLAQLFTYAETMARSQWAEAKIEPWENSSLGSSLTRHIHGHAESEKDTSSHRSRQVKSKQLAGKHDVFTHSESSPNHQFSAVVPPPGQSGFDVHFERMGSAPLKNDTWDDNFAQLFAYSLTKTPSAAPPAIAGSHATAYTLEESTDEEEERHPASCPVAVKYQAPARNVDAYNLAESTDEEEERLPASCPVAVKYKSPASNADAHNLAESTDEEEERLPAHLPVAVKYQARGSNADAHNLAESTDEEEERHPASCPVAVKGQARVSPDGSRRSSAATNETATSFQPSSASTEDGKADAKAKKGEKGKDEQQRKRTDKNRPKYAGGCAEGWSTEEVRQFWFNQKNRTGEEASKAALDKGMSLEASSDPNDPIYYWQLYSVLGPDRIQKLIHAFYSNVYADDDDPRLRNVFMRMPGRSVPPRISCARNLHADVPSRGVQGGQGCRTTCDSRPRSGWTRSGGGARTREGGSGWSSITDTARARS
eukprot:1700574-Rhodomonas_salina.2